MGADAAPDRRLRSLGESAVSAFGENEARDLLATLGSPEQASPRKKDCTCAAASDYCGPMLYCENEWSCNESSWGCGAGWAYKCDGLCTTFD
jgi:hypothetical protein